MYPTKRYEIKFSSLFGLPIIFCHPVILRRMSHGSGHCVVSMLSSILVLGTQRVKGLGGDLGVLVKTSTRLENNKKKLKVCF